MAEDTGKSKERIPPDGERDDTLYQVMANRRCSYDSMLWSTPVISLAGLAFLFNIAFSPQTAEWPRRFASFLAVCFAFASAHLLYKHRYREKSDSEWLQAYEERHFSCLPVHGKPNPVTTWLARTSAYCIWQVLLIVFFLAACFVLLMACFNTGWFQPSG